MMPEEVFREPVHRERERAAEVVVVVIAVEGGEMGRSVSESRDWRPFSHRLLP